MKYPKDKAINEAFQEHGMKVGETYRGSERGALTLSVYITACDGDIWYADSNGVEL